ncbi:MAG: DUF4365 domain-containing protein [Bacteroidales bacterium]|nr:DUF4365 domain-containing protein [Bacteroidales bacterium]
MNLFSHSNYSEIKSSLKIGRLGEYWVKFCLTLHDFDVYNAEVDNKAIDFIVRINKDLHFDVQVKTIRNATTSYVFIQKKFWPEDELRDTLYLALVILSDNESPHVYLIPSVEWKSSNDYGLFCSNDYGPEKKSKPEWGLRLSKKNYPLLESYAFEKQTQLIKEKFHLI